MLTDYSFKPHLVKRILLVAHKGKKKDYLHPPHKHGRDVYEMIYADYGKIELKINEKIIHLEPGNAIFISVSSEHSFCGIDRMPFDYLNIMFIGKIPNLLLDRVLTVNKNSMVLMEKLKEESIHDLPYKNEVIACNLTELVIQFFRQANSSLPNKPIEAAYRIRYKSEIINRAINVIAGNYSNPLNLKKLSLSVNVSVPTLRVLIKNETGENFTTILHKHRIDAAKYLLRQEELSIMEIANAVGYTSTSFFFKIFKRLTGMTPKEYALSLGDPLEVK